VSDRRPQSLDTTAAAEDRQFAVWLAMTPAQKLAAWAELQAMAHALAEAGIRREHPHASDREVFLRRVARTLDRATMLRCYGWAADEGAAPATGRLPVWRLFGAGGAICGRTHRSGSDAGGR